MKLPALFVIFFLLSSGLSYAKSSASVTIDNNVSSSSNSEVKSSTDIRIETNGNVTSYSSNEPGKIEVKSEDGNSEIKVNGQVVSSPTQTNPTKTPTPTEPDKDGDEDDKTESNKNIFEVFEDIFKIVFSLLV